jgi:dTDP-4-dehydrorhamnose 3,5-epimerase
MCNEFRLSERNPGLVVIPPNLYHGWKNIGIDEAFIINMPSSQYHHEEPDALDLPYDSSDAAELVPFRW